MTRPIPTIAELAFTRIATAVCAWLAAHTCQPEETTEARKDEADAELDAVLRCEARIRMDQAIEAIEAIEAIGYGVLVVLDDGQELTISATTGHINRY